MSHEQINGRQGAVGIEDQLVSAAMQLSDLRQQMKALNRALDSKDDEIASLKAELASKTRRLEQENEARARDRHEHQGAVLASSEELNRLRAVIHHHQDDPAKEEMEKNEKEAVETARKAYMEVERCNDHIEKLKAALAEARPAAANRQGELVSASSAAAATAAANRGAGAASAAPTSSVAGRSRYSMADDGEEDAASVGGGQEGGKGAIGDTDDEEEEEEEAEEDDDDKPEGGFWSWLTRSAKKRRRGE